MQSKVLAIAAIENMPRLEALLECESINRMAAMQPKAENVEKAASFPVDAVVMFTSGLGPEETDFLEKLYMSRGRLAFVLVCDFVDAELLARAMECGVTKVLTADMGQEAVCRAVEAEITRVQSRSESARVQNLDSRVLSVFSTKGGSGKTTVAVNLAVALADIGKQVALIDLDLQFGDVGVFLNVPRCDTVSDLVGEQILSPAVVKSYLYKHASGVKILCAPVSPELAEMVKPSHIERIVTVLRAEFDYIIMDLAPNLDDNALTALEQSDTVYFVTNPEIPTLKNTRTCMGILRTLGYDKKLQLVLNRDGDSFVSKKDVARSLDMEPVLTVPYDMKASSSAINRGIPVVTASPHSKMSKAFIKFVKQGSV